MMNRRTKSELPALHLCGAPSILTCQRMVQHARKRRQSHNSAADQSPVPVRPGRVTLIRGATRLENARRMKDAIALWRELTVRFPRNADGWFHLGAALDSSGKMSEAIPCYLRALRLKPNHPRQYEMCLYLASSYGKTGRPAAAQRWLTKAASFERDDPLEHRLKRQLNKSQTNTRFGFDKSALPAHR